MTGAHLQLLIAVVPFAGLFLFCLHMAGKAAWRAHFRNRAYRRATGLDYEQVLDLVQSLPVLEPIEPIKLTREQWASIKLLVEVVPTPSWHVPTVNPLFGTPIHIVERVEESTRHLKGW